MLFKNVAQNEIDKEILKFLEQKDILRPRKSYSLKQLDPVFQEYKDLNEKVFDELVLLIKEEPQLIIETTKDFLDKREILTKIFSLGRKLKGKKDNELKVFERIEVIADFYETVEILKLGAYLLSQRKTPFKGLNSKDSILKHYGKLELSKNDRNNIRLIRNANSHKFSITENSIITIDGNEIKIKEIEMLQKKVDQISSWWMTFFIFNMLFIPKLGLLVLMGTFLSVNNNKGEWDKFKKGVDLFFADIFENQKREKEKTLKKRIKRVKSKFRIFIKYKVLRKIGIKKDKDFIFNHAPLIMNRLEYHLQCLLKEVKDIVASIKHEGDKKLIGEFANWLEKNHQELVKLISFLKNHPDKFQDRLEKWRSK